jgi:hypothetical protein
VLAVAVALLVVALTDLAPAPVASRAELFERTARLVALLVAFGALPGLAHRLGPLHARAIRLLGLGLGALLALDLHAIHAIHVLGVPTHHAVAPVRALACLAALVLVVPLLTFAIARILRAAPPPPGLPADGVRRIAAALCGLGGTAIAAASLLKLGIDEHVQRDSGGVALVVIAALPACLFLLLLLRGLWQVGRAGGLGLAAATLFTTALVVETLQAIGCYRGWIAVDSARYGGWLGAAAMTGPFATALALIALGQVCHVAVRGRGGGDPGRDVACFTAFAITMIGLFAPLVVTPGTEEPYLAMTVVIIPWLAPLLCVPMLLRTARAIEADAMPPTAALRAG